MKLLIILLTIIVSAQGCSIICTDGSSCSSACDYDPNLEGVCMCSKINPEQPGVATCGCSGERTKTKRTLLKPIKKEPVLKESVSWTANAPQGTCLVYEPSAGDYPTCFREVPVQDVNHPEMWSMAVCCGESPFIGGGSFDVNPGSFQYPITRIATTRSKKCNAPAGINSTTFHTHCGCGGWCKIEGYWTIYWNSNLTKTDQTPNLVCETGGASACAAECVAEGHYHGGWCDNHNVCHCKPN